MLVEHHRINDLHCYRYKPEQADYAIVISHGLAGHGGIYDVFCEHHAGKNVDIWSYDAPGHGLSTANRPRGQWTMEEWVQGGRDIAKHVKENTGLPVFLLGSSLGVAAAISGADSPDVTGVICMGSPAVPGSPPVAGMGAVWRSDEVKQLLSMLGRAAKLDIQTFFNFDEDYGWHGALEQKKLDPNNSWSYDLQSWASFFQYDPPVMPQDNTKPVFYTSGEKDPGFPPELIKMAADSIGGPVELKIFEGATHQLMLFHTAEYSDAVDAFCRKHI